MLIIGFVLGYVVGSPTRKEKVFDAMKPEPSCACKEAAKGK